MAWNALRVIALLHAMGVGLHQARWGVGRSNHQFGVVEDQVGSGLGTNMDPRGSLNGSPTTFHCKIFVSAPVYISKSLSA